MSIFKMMIWAARGWIVQMSLVLVLAVLVPLWPGHAQSVSLKQNALITETTLRLSDIFHGLAPEQDKVIGAAPRPGQDMTLNARTLLRVALSQNLDWRPVSSAESITIRRDATVIEREDILSALKSGLSARGVKGAFDLLLTEGQSRIILPPDQQAVFDIDDLQINREQKTFRAVLKAPSRDNPVQSLVVAGMMQSLLEVPVLKRTLHKGDVIAAQDIEFVQVKERDLRRDVVLNTEALIGLTPRRVIMAGDMIKSNALQTPKIVARGDIVTMTFQNGALQLTAQGKALENGAAGEVIRVVNMGSSKTLRAVITGAKEVAVQTF